MEIQEYKAEAMTEPERIQLYEELRATGLSDSESRGTAWPEDYQKKE